MTGFDEKLFGFRYLRFLELFDWILFELSPTAGWVENFVCPCDETRLRAVVSLYGQSGKQKVRIGSCDTCGYIGYIDRPTKQWIKDFYLNTWEDTESPKVKKLVYKIKHGKDKKEREILDIIRGLSLDPSRPICEIGCGYGSALNQIRELGFSNLIAIENSKHRADFAREFFKLEVLTAPFEDAQVQQRLKEKGAPSLIFSHHVFEHVYDPSELIGLASGLQKEGDYFVISVPNAVGEFSMSNILYFPHLHSFRVASLVRLLNRYNYQVVDHSRTTNTGLHVVAKKVSAVPPHDFPKENYFEKAVEKFTRGVGLGKRYSFVPRRLWWLRAFNVGGQARYFKNKSLDNLFWSTIKKLIPHQFKKEILREAGPSGLTNRQPIQSILVDNLEKRYSSFEESPIEIHYDGNIVLTYK